MPGLDPGIHVLLSAGSSPAMTKEAVAKTRVDMTTSCRGGASAPSRGDGGHGHKFGFDRKGLSTKL
jgi:hypothetical protein